MQQDHDGQADDAQGNGDLQEVYPRVAQAILCFLEEGLVEAMNRFNA